MQDLALFILILIGIAAGFQVGRYYQRKKMKRLSAKIAAYHWPQKRYYQGLTQLLNDQPDAAIDTFISALEVNADTLETHLALGNLLRRRGEVDRAIRVHQNLLARPSLSKKQSLEAQMELAVDYMRSGLLDRAESLFKELAAQNGASKQLRDKALKNLLEVYQDMREWLSAIDVADQLTTRKFSAKTDLWRERQAQYSCEIAEEAMAHSDWQQARRWLRNAERYDKRCARALLLQAKLYFVDQDYANSIATLKRVPEIDDRYLPEALAQFVESYRMLKLKKTLLDALIDLYKEYSHLALLREIIAWSLLEEVDFDSLQFDVFDQLNNHQQLLTHKNLLAIIAQYPTRETLEAIQALLDSVLHYQCIRCGFSGDVMHWQCPSCKNWGTVFQV